jgi:ribosomal protein S3AE
MTETLKNHAENIEQQVTVKTKKGTKLRLDAWLQTENRAITCF